MSDGRELLEAGGLSARIAWLHEAAAALRTSGKSLLGAGPLAQFVAGNLQEPLQVFRSERIHLTAAIKATEERLVLIAYPTEFLVALETAIRALDADEQIMV
jgi:hypothetical protein